MEKEIEQDSRKSLTQIGLERAGLGMLLIATAMILWLKYELVTTRDDLSECTALVQHQSSALDRQQATIDGLRATAAQSPPATAP